jgi:hypothetical protein
LPNSINPPYPSFLSPVSATEADDGSSWIRKNSAEATVDADSSELLRVQLQWRTALSHQIEATDWQIDRFVYELYGLTDEEIRIVERVTAS